MSLTTQTKRRLPTIKASLMLGLNRGQIAEKLHVNEKTIDRDFKTWVASNDFEIWLKEEWLRLHNLVLHEDLIEAYKQISKLCGQMLTRKIERKEQIEISEEIVTVNVTENEDEILSKASAILARKDRFNKIH